MCVCAGRKNKLDTAPFYTVYNCASSNLLRTAGDDRQLQGVHEECIVSVYVLLVSVLSSVCMCVCVCVCVCVCACVRACVCWA